MRQDYRYNTPPDPHSIGWVTLIQVFLIRTSNIFISYITRTVVNEKPLFHILGLPPK